MQLLAELSYLDLLAHALKPALHRVQRASGQEGRIAGQLCQLALLVAQRADHLECALVHLQYQVKTATQPRSDVARSRDPICA